MSVGDVNSTERGSGARYNDGKVPFDLLPLTILADTLPAGLVRTAMALLGLFQETADIKYLHALFNTLGAQGGMEECARVMDYGSRKYAAWNWAKGMAWSIPLACAARHLWAMAFVDPLDPESGLPHRGHVFANVVMLLTFQRTFPEGNDLPVQLRDQPGYPFPALPTE